MKILYVTVRVEVEDTVDPDEFASEVDYSFNFNGLMDTEIVEVIETGPWITKPNRS